MAQKTNEIVNDLFFSDSGEQIDARRAMIWADAKEYLRGLERWLNQADIPTVRSHLRAKHGEQEINLDYLVIKTGLGNELNMAILPEFVPGRENHFHLSFIGATGPDVLRAAIALGKGEDLESLSWIPLKHLNQRKKRYGYRNSIEVIEDKLREISSCLHYCGPAQKASAYEVFQALNACIYYLESLRAPHNDSDSIGYQEVDISQLTQILGGKDSMEDPLLQTNILKPIGGSTVQGVFEWLGLSEKDLDSPGAAANHFGYTSYEAISRSLNLKSKTELQKLSAIYRELESRHESLRRVIWPYEIPQLSPGNPGCEQDSASENEMNQKIESWVDFLEAIKKRYRKLDRAFHRIYGEVRGWTG